MQQRSPEAAGPGKVFGRIVLVFTALVLAVLLAGTVAGVALWRSLSSSGDTSTLHDPVLNALGISRTSEVQVTLPAWGLTLARAGSSVADLGTEVQTALGTVQNARIGVYKLARRPNRSEVLNWIHSVDTTLDTAVWKRTLTVLEGAQMVSIYLADSGEEDTRFLEALILVQDQQELVIVSARGRTEALLNLGRHALTELDLTSMDL
jgi:hypothetical protein